jgi:hypothetical protein
VFLTHATYDSASLSKLDLSGNSIGGTAGEPGVKAIAEALKVNRTITEINLASNRFDAECAAILAQVVEATGSLSSANLLGNWIGVEQAQALLNIKEAKPGLRTLCGLSGDETELDLSGKGLGPGCAILLAPEMEAKPLSHLDLSSNSLVCDVTYVKASEVSGKIEKGSTVQYQGAALVITYVNSDGSVDLRDTRGLMSLANAIQDMGALAFKCEDGNEFSACTHHRARYECTHQMLHLCLVCVTARVSRAIVGFLWFESTHALIHCASWISSLSNANHANPPATSPCHLCHRLSCHPQFHPCHSGVLASLNLSKNGLGAEGAKIIAEVLPEW